MLRTPDFLVLGGGIIGLCVARALRRRHPSHSVVLLEKEREVGYHASGRNSGVLHAGFYYSADSLKARFCRDGNKALRTYIREKGLALNECGKLVVARSARDLPQLDELLRRARANLVPLHSITEREAQKIEPRVKTHERALWSPATATADPVAVIHALKADARREGIEIIMEAAYRDFVHGDVHTTAGSFSPGFVVNAAGLHADQIALDFGFSQNYRIVPFKGLYLYSDEPAGAFRTNIYPVPDLRNPFLGVHFTLTGDGHTKIGPTAIPAFWREQYSGLSRFDPVDFCEIALRDLQLFFGAGFNFRQLAFEELHKYSRARMVELAAELATGIDVSQFNHWGKPGIRAQLVHLKSLRLEMDFVIEGDHQSLHILNAVSPAWTCSFPFAEHVCDQISAHLNRSRPPATH